jgi:hypothetical protein
MRSPLSLWTTGLAHALSLQVIHEHYKTFNAVQCITIHMNTEYHKHHILLEHMIFQTAHYTQMGNRVSAQWFTGRH